MGLLTMEQVAKTRKPKGKVEHPPDEKPRKPMILQVRGSEEFKVWFEELAQFDGLTPTGVFDRAVRKYAKEVGFIKEPPKR